MMGVTRSEKSAALGKGTSCILLLVPGLCADRGQKALHGSFIAAQELAVQVAWIPIDQDAAEIENGSRRALLAHALTRASGRDRLRVLFCLLQSSLNQLAGGVGIKTLDCHHGGAGLLDEDWAILAQILFQSRLTGIGLRALQTGVALRQGGRIDLGELARRSFVGPLGNVIKADMRAGVRVGGLDTFPPGRVVRPPAPVWTQALGHGVF